MRRLLLPTTVLTLGLALSACGNADTPADTETTAADSSPAMTMSESPTADPTSSDAASDTPAADAPTKDIVDTAVEAGSFSTLATALTEAGLVDTLKSEGPFTVFAPTDDAFAKLPSGALDTLLAAPKEKLAPVLTYHVVPGKVMAADVLTMDGEKVKTVNGAELTIKVDGTNVMLMDAAGGQATVTATDVEASNGVIHVIDTVLMPE